MKRSKKGTDLSVVKKVLIGCGVAVGISLLGSLVTAILLSREVLEVSNIGYAVMLVTAIASAVGAWMTVRGMTKNRLLLAAATAAAYYIVLLAAGIAMFDGPGGGVGVTALLVIGCGCCAALLGIKEKKKRYSYRGKTVNR